MPAILEGTAAVRDAFVLTKTQGFDAEVHLRGWLRLELSCFLQRGYRHLKCWIRIVT